MLRTTLLTFVLAAVAAFAQPALAQTVDADGLLRDPAGRTLYVFDRDHPWGASNCYEGCAEAWPAFVATIGAEVKDQLSVHTRTDGRMQWGWNGKPLYYFAGDRQPGDAEGDGLGGVWHAVRTTPPAATQSVQLAPEVPPWQRF
jgi:predicted lipoprotein with Yx(FWY)xxD motif